MNIRTIAWVVMQLFVFRLTSRSWTATLLMLSFDLYDRPFHEGNAGVHSIGTVIFGVYKHRTGV
jgi:hypothetical protein